MLCVQAPASEPRQWGHSGDASLAGGRPHADGNHRRVRRAENWGRSNRGRAGVRAVIKDRLLGRPHIAGATCSRVLGPDLFSRARFLTLVQALGTRGGLLCALTCCRGSGPTLTLSHSCFLSISPKPVGKGQRGDGWGKTALLIIFAFLMRKPTGKKTGA